MPLAAIVSDDTLLLIEISQVLDEEGWAVLTVRESTAFASIKREHPDLIIFDMRTERPETGWAALEMLRKEPDIARTPVLVTTSEHDDNPSKRPAAGVVTVLRKPFDIAQLLPAINEALQRAGPATIVPEA
jgi:CheY-like chemotaxis protein